MNTKVVAGVLQVLNLQINTGRDDWEPGIVEREGTTGLRSKRLTNLFLSDHSRPFVVEMLFLCLSAFICG